MIYTVKSFSELDAYISIGSGEYKVMYNDTSHLPADSWRRILTIDVARHPTDVTLGDAHHNYTVRADVDPDCKDYEKYLNDALALCFARVGLLEPTIDSHLRAEIDTLRGQSGIILIPDTNSLHNGSLHWLLQTLGHATVWILPFVMSLTQIQEKDTKLKSIYKAGKPNNAREALRSRAMVNASLGVLERNKSRYQVGKYPPAKPGALRM